MRAYGHTFQSLHWLSDLNVTLCHLLGQLCSNLLTTPPAPAGLSGGASGAGSKEEEVGKERREEELLVDSDMWKTLFRGGYRIGKLTRSLSGACVCVAPS